MRNRNQGNGKKRIPEISLRVIPLSGPDERTEVLKNLAISSEFSMRYRGLFEYYGKELIAYKLEKPKDEDRNEFLRSLSHYMTTYLEDSCPSSWEECGPAFWEQFIFHHFPKLFLKLTPNENQVVIFLNQLKRFVRWLDKRVGTSWYPLIESFHAVAHSELTTCERLLNALFVYCYPQMYQADWDPIEDIKKNDEDFNLCAERWDSLFEVTGILGEIIEITEDQSGCHYHVAGLPYQYFVKGILVSGAIGRKSEDIYWNWYSTEGVLPPSGKKYCSSDAKCESHI
nr:hypothetical protein [Neobacillus sp. Marseille-Q6967]